MLRSRLAAECSSLSSASMPKPALAKSSRAPLPDVFSWIWALGLVLIVSTIVAYLPAIRGDYIWDDESYITNNTLLHDLDGLRRIWINVASSKTSFEESSEVRRSLSVTSELTTMHVSH